MDAEARWRRGELADATSHNGPETTKTLPEQGLRVVRRQGFEPRTR
jgi:hypothetical protein